MHTNSMSDYRPMELLRLIRDLQARVAQLEDTVKEQASTLDWYDDRLRAQEYHSHE